MVVDWTIRDKAETLILRVIRRNLPVGPDTQVWVLHGLAVDIAASLAAGHYFRKDENDDRHVSLLH